MVWTAILLIFSLLPGKPIARVAATTANGVSTIQWSPVGRAEMDRSNRAKPRRQSGDHEFHPGGRRQ